MEQTFPRLADQLGYVAKDDILYVVKAIVATQRDYGRRDDRRMSRMKYVVEEWGIHKFKTVVEQYFGKSIQPFKELPPFKFQSYLGWHEQVNDVVRFLFYCTVLLCYTRRSDWEWVIIVGRWQFVFWLAR